ncbi:diacylglycerol kinase [Arundinibacter roseus]|uniref:Diacylglycerol kinase n=1 Tax=Arundinibacter roseus TaxID=2070510 RepID=A0A4R4KDR2_9BACT|nr:diacylglycerol kinase [Arundinibacter roseus]
MSYLFLINPRAGTRLGQEAQQLAATLQTKTVEAGHLAECILTQAKGHATELAAAAVDSRKWDCVVAVGGDGTVNEVASALVHSQVPLGILPLGSGNGLARHLGIPLGFTDALTHLFSGQPHLIDSATLNQQPFFCVAGLGFDAYVGHLFGQQLHRGIQTYVKVAMQAYWDYAPKRVRINEQTLEIFSLSFANAGQFGNNAWVAPQADLSDGKLEICTVRPFPKWYGTALTYWLFTKQMKPSTYISYEALPGLTVQTEQPALVHFDGEPWQLDTTTVEVCVIPKSLWVIH